MLRASILRFLHYSCVVGVVRAKRFNISDSLVMEAEI